MTSRKGKTPMTIQRQPEIHTMGLDIGYGNTKAVSDAGSVTFPSVAGYSRQIDFNFDEISGNHPGEHLSDSHGDWFIGDLAISQLKPAQQLMLTGRTANDDERGMEFRIRMMMAAMAKLFPYTHGDAVHLRVATGLPVNHMRNASRMKEMLIGTHKIATNNANFVANITDVMVMPQPYGTLYSQQFLPSGELDPHYTPLRTGIVDVGRFTVDCALDDNGEFIGARSGSVEAGVHTVQERIIKDIEFDSEGYTPSYSEVETVLRTKRFKARGEWKDYGQEVEAALKPLRDSTLTLMNELWGNGTSIDAIWITGGGGRFVEDVVKRAYPHAALVQDAQIANALGYLNYARFIANQ